MNDYSETSYRAMYKSLRKACNLPIIVKVLGKYKREKRRAERYAKMLR